jgi:uncharacterized protein (UPF0147 family)
MADELETLLNTYHANTLWEMADAAGLRVTTPTGKRLRKATVIAKMQAEYFTRERVEASLARVKERERAALDRILLHGGRVPTKSLERELMRAGLVTVHNADESSRGSYGHSRRRTVHEGNPRRARSTEFADVMARLTYFGLVFSEGAPLTTGNTPAKLQYHPGTILLVPEAVRRHLPQPEPILPERGDWAPDEVRPAAPELLLRDLYLYWDFVRRNEVPLLQSGLVGKRSLRAINGTLLAPDPLLDEAGREDQTEWLYLLRIMLEALGLVRRQRGQLESAGEDATKIPAFWSWPLSRQARVCLDAWVGLGPLNEREEEAGQYGPRLPHARQQLIATLQTLPVDTWFETADLLERIQDLDMDFLFPDHLQMEAYRGNWYYSNSGSYFYGSTRDLLDRFEKMEERFVSSAVTGILHALGVVDLGRYRGRWGAFRLTEDGRQILGEKRTQVEPDQEEGKILVQPNFQVLAMGPVDLAWLARLDLFADRQQADRGAFLYDLTRTSVYRALQLGMEMDEILAWLQDASEVEVPQNVRRTVEEWGAHYERIVFRSGASLLQAADAALLDEMLDDPDLGSHVARRVSPEVALIKEEGLENLVTKLVDQGLFPAVSGAEPQAADGSVLIRPDGQVVSIHAVPSLHLRGRLARLAEEVGDGTWRLTPASVRRAGGSKAKVDWLLAELGRLQRGTLSKKLVEQIKAWGGYYGNASVATLTLIEFRDREALESLRQHPGLDGYLTPFPAGDRALAAVPHEKLAEVKEALGQLGVNVRDGL